MTMSPEQLSALSPLDRMRLMAWEENRRAGLGRHGSWVAPPRAVDRPPVRPEKPMPREALVAVPARVFSADPVAVLLPPAPPPVAAPAKPKGVFPYDARGAAEARRERVARMLEAGHPIGAIAHLVGVSLSTIKGDVLRIRSNAAARQEVCHG